VSDPFKTQADGFGAPRRDRRQGGPSLIRSAQRRPQMVEVSRDGRRVYLSNGLYVTWERTVLCRWIRGWVTKLDANPGGGLTHRSKFFVEFEIGLHQIHSREETPPRIRTACMRASCHGPPLAVLGAYHGMNPGMAGCSRSLVACKNSVEVP